MLLSQESVPPVHRCLHDCRRFVRRKHSAEVEGVGLGPLSPSKAQARGVHQSRDPSVGTSALPTAALPAPLPLDFCFDQSGYIVVDARDITQRV